MCYLPPPEGLQWRGGAPARCRRQRCSGDARRRHRRSPRTRTPPNGSTSESASADRRGRGTLPRQSRKATPAGAARAARRSGSEFAKRMSSGDARRRHRRSPRTRTRLNGLTKKCSSEHRPGPGFRTAKSERPLRAQGHGDIPRKKRTPPNGLTKKCSSEHRPGPGFRAAKSERPLRAQGHGDIPRKKRTPPNGLTKKSASADRRGRGTLQRKVGKRLERRRGTGMCPVKKGYAPQKKEPGLRPDSLSG